MIVTVTPNPSVDRTYEIPALAPGEINRATRVHQEPSGKGVNVTRALTVNGVPSVAVFPRGGAEGDVLTAAAGGGKGAVPGGADRRRGAGEHLGDGAGRPGHEDQ